ncbi:unnamed protein product [Prorocentrum cordatum]|uniref:Uncharacterized protein n=1 Tax=Prorocentrum cordatum TaxID=2364126 RepID=A0ABN9W730_9DINO|nr:unnamed protein product [Polarella glacialis]
MELAQAEVDFWKSKVPSDHPKLLQAQQTLEEYLQKSFLSLPGEVQAKRLQATANAEWNKVNSTKAELIDAKCDAYQQLAININEKLDKLKGKIQQLKILETSLTPADPKPEPSPQQIIAYMKEHPQEVSNLSEPEILTKVLSINDTSKALEKKHAELKEMDGGIEAEVQWLAGQAAAEKARSEAGHQGLPGEPAADAQERPNEDPPVGDGGSAESAEMTGATPAAMPTAANPAASKARAAGASQAPSPG